MGAQGPSATSINIDRQLSHHAGNYWATAVHYHLTCHPYSHYLTVYTLSLLGISIKLCRLFTLEINPNHRLSLSWWDETKFSEQD